MKVPALFLATTLLGTAATAQQEPLGRLFYTPEQRAVLDRQRLTGRLSLSTPATGEALTINGMVKRSNGRSTVWVNGEETDRTQLSPPGKMPYKVGETIISGTDERQDLVGSGTITIRRPSAGVR